MRTCVAGGGPGLGGAVLAPVVLPVAGVALPEVQTVVARAVATQKQSYSSLGPDGDADQDFSSTWTRKLFPGIGWCWSPRPQWGRGCRGGWPGSPPPRPLRPPPRRTAVHQASHPHHRRSKRSPGAESGAAGAQPRMWKL